MAVPKLSQLREELVDREAIRDCLLRYSRGVDRCDEDMLRSAYWEDAVDDHAVFTGGREELIAWVMPLLREREATSHNIDNIIIRIDGDSAHSETYFQGYHCLRKDGKAWATLQGGRYLDRLEKRDDEWRIANRKVVVDWFREIAHAGDWQEGPLGHAEIERGKRYPDDASYGFLKLF